MSLPRPGFIDGRPGALLADDMGLGKTLEALAFLAWLKESGVRSQSARPILIVAPTGLLKNWQEEHDEHLLGEGLGELVEAHGGGLRRLRDAEKQSSETASGIPSLDVRTLESADWVMTTYETLRDYIHSFGRVRWAAVVFDEAQKIKNPAARMTDAAKAMNADFAVALTGTPVENRLADLWCIVDAVQPGRLGSLKDFSLKYESGPVEESVESLAALREMVGGGDVPRVMLRRLKEDHLEGLPEKEIVPMVREMPERQASTYEELVRRGRDGAQVMEVLQGLRNVSLHPYKRDQETDEEYLADSARLLATFEVLDRIFAASDKALLFIESRDMQASLSEILQRRYGMPAPPLIINGAVAGSRRRQRVDVFQGRPGFDVMLVSPKAGGVGLTMTAANHVIHLSRWWNPAVEDQCTDRAHRIGQHRKVFVYIPKSRHPTYGDLSFDLILNDLLARKRGLNRSVLAPPAMTSRDRNALYDSTILGKPNSPDTVTEVAPPRVPAVNSGPSVSTRTAPIDTKGPEPEWIAALLAAGPYRVGREQGGRLVPPDDRVRLVLHLLSEHGGTMTRVAIGAELGLPNTRVQTLLNAMRQLLNLDGYDILQIEESSESVRINFQLLKTQFGLPLGL